LWETNENRLWLLRRTSSTRWSSSSWPDEQQQQQHCRSAADANHNHRFILHLHSSADISWHPPELLLLFLTRQQQTDECRLTGSDWWSNFQMFTVAWYFQSTHQEHFLMLFETGAFWLPRKSPHMVLNNQLVANRDVTLWLMLRCQNNL
jgi:hypothetical protein